MTIDQQILKTLQQAASLSIANAMLEEDYLKVAKEAYQLEAEEFKREVKTKQELARKLDEGTKS
jgi:hypothetical protein